LIVACGILESEASPSEPDEHPTQEDQDMNNNEIICEVMMKSDEFGKIKHKNQLTSA